MTTTTRIRDEDLNDKAIKRVASERVERGLEWLEENAPRGYVFEVFKIPREWPFSQDHEPQYIANKSGTHRDSLLVLAFKSKRVEIEASHALYGNYTSVASVEEWFRRSGKKVPDFKELGLSAQYTDARVCTLLNQLWKEKMRTRLQEELQKLFPDHKDRRRIPLKEKQHIARELSRPDRPLQKIVRGRYDRGDN